MLFSCVYGSLSRVDRDSVNCGSINVLRLSKIDDLRILLEELFAPMIDSEYRKLEEARRSQGGSTASILL